MAAKCFIFCAYLLFVVVWGIGDQNLIQDEHVRAIPKDFEDLDDFYNEFKADISLEAFINDLTKSISGCYQSFGKASVKVEDLLDSYSIEAYDLDFEFPSDSAVNIDNDQIEDLFVSLSRFSNEEEDVLDKNFLNKMKFGEGEKPHYLKQAEIVLRAIDKACSSLPNAFTVTRFEHRPREAARMLVKSLTRWMERWTHSIEVKFKIFLNSCLEHKPCKPFLKKIIERWINFSKLSHGEISKETSNILQQLLEDIKWDRKKHPHLSELQRLALSDEFDGFYAGENDSEFDFAQKISGIEINHQTQFVDIVSSFQGESKFALKQPQGEIEIELDQLLRTVPDTFLSVAFGSSLIQEHFLKFKHRYSRLVSLASAFSPALLRVGGSSANFLTFDPTANLDPNVVNIIKEKYVYSVGHPKIRHKNEEMINAYEVNRKAKPSSKHPKYISEEQYSIFLQDMNDVNNGACEPQLNKELKNFTMTEQDMKFLADFIHDLGWPLLFDLNQFWRDPRNNWDPTNARLIFKETNKLGLKVYWQLGNEPNAYNHKYDWQITPQRAAEDYLQLKQELVKANLNPFIVGPDVTRPRHVDDTPLIDTLSTNLDMDSVDFLIDFLKDAESFVNVITFHQYYVDGKTATLEEFLSPETMNLFVMQVDKFVNIVETVAPNKPIWITETADAWGGGAPGLSNRFAGGFLWLDKLGAAALGGVSCVIRQTLYGGCYALLDQKLNPKPDYWVSVLHKQLVGRGVLMPRARLASHSLRIYSQCLRKDHKLYKQGSVVLFGMNTSNKTEKLTLFNQDLQSSDIYRYTLSAPQNDLTSSDILLNDQLLEPNSKGEIPELIPLHNINTGEIEFLPYTMSFWVFTEAHSVVC